MQTVTSVQAIPVAAIPKLAKISRAIALTGVVLPLLLIGLLKFTQVEVEALKPLISGTPWLAWLYPVFGETGTSYLLGTVEMFTAILLIASPWSARAAIAGSLLAALTFLTTVSTMLVLPIWEAASGGFPWFNFLGTFLIKDVALFGVSLVILTEGIQRLRERLLQTQES
ncbi:DUF417 family protein [Stutzerimonas azotifigens]|uniref:DUF417 family protein n=1 Tax=Stutzerimonas azotifigens TaxID=291995 RepID=A0ABR5Z5P8_9GAMM|nr:DUF417 family protein [Stutzerimonas azotifigens]MBA1275452.1 DUF417 family protein [Stutzerimonas azotifigens]